MIFPSCFHFFTFFDFVNMQEIIRGNIYDWQMSPFFRSPYLVLMVSTSLHFE